MYHTCPMCAGPAVPLGVLGHNLWLRCRNCGAEFYTEDDTNSVTESDEECLEATSP